MKLNFFLFLLTFLAAVTLTSAISSDSGNTFEKISDENININATILDVIKIEGHWDTSKHHVDYCATLLSPLIKKLGCTKGDSIIGARLDINIPLLVHGFIKVFEYNLCLFADVDIDVRGRHIAGAKVEILCH